MIQVMYQKEKNMSDLLFAREMSSFYKLEKDLDSDFINILNEIIISIQSLEIFLNFEIDI